MELRGATALVTGAHGGLGTAICEELGRRGANLVTSDVPGSGATIEADLSVPEGPALLAGAAGEVDVLVNNAGVEFLGAFLNHTPDELRAITAINLLAPMELTRLLLPGMVERGRGHVVNIASLAGKVPSRWTSTYTATKHGLVGFTHSMRAEYADSPIGFSVICPGYITEAGMLGPHHEDVAAPRALGSLPPSSVGNAVAEAIEKSRAEVIVNQRPVKPIIGLAATAPEAAARLVERVGVNDVWRQVAERKGRL